MSHHPAWLLILLGLIALGVGTAWLLFPSIPWLGRLPGDIYIKTETTRVYFPITTCVLVSLTLTALLWFIRYIAR